MYITPPHKEISIKMLFVVNEIFTGFKKINTLENLNQCAVEVQPQKTAPMLSKSKNDMVTPIFSIT